MPTNKHRIAINLDDEEFSELDAMADRHDVSLSWIGRQAVLEFLSRYKDQQLPLPLRIESRSTERL
jgi:predicted transcriptional regulator